MINNFKNKQHRKIIKDIIKEMHLNTNKMNY